MMTEGIGLSHRELLQERLNNIHTGVSDFSFANLYLFRHVHDYRIHRGEDVFISGKTYEGIPYLMVTRPVKEMDPGLIREMVEEYGMMFPVPEEWLDFFPDSEYEHLYHESDSDYVFTVEKMSTYKGKKLHGKRNLLRQFLDQYSYEKYPLTRERTEDARRILDKWQEGMADPPEMTDYAACREALELYEELSLCGAIYYVEGEPAGFMLGEGIREDMFALHFAKGDKRFKGLYQFMYNSCARVLPETIRYINFEQDLGKRELRLAKSSYLPDLMIRKYRIYPRNRENR